MEGVTFSSQSDLASDSDEMRWRDIELLLRRASPLVHPAFEPSEENGKFIREQCRILVIGAGGLGCELLKDLALVGFGNIDVIDLDIIDVTNLNRQFLFRKSDVGKSKAVVAAEFIMKRVNGVTVRAHMANIMDFDASFYRQFHIIVAGLDSIDARRWLNAFLVNLVQHDEQTGEIDPSTVIPLVDGGTEGFRGHARVILPRISSCFECTLGLFPPQEKFPLCTIANTPRLPEHCIEYAHLVLWNSIDPFGRNGSVKNNNHEGNSDLSLTPAVAVAQDQVSPPAGDNVVKFDGDNPEHVKWVYEQAKKRADQFGIRNVTYKLTLGVVKNIIPAVASTNAIIAAVSSHECLKIATYMAASMDDYLMYLGENGIYTYTYKNEKKSDCPVCGVPHRRTLEVDPQSKLVDLLDMIRNDAEFRTAKPSLRVVHSGAPLYFSTPAVLEEQTRANLSLEMCKIVSKYGVSADNMDQGESLTAEGENAVASKRRSLHLSLSDAMLPFVRDIMIKLRPGSDSAAV